MLSKFILGIFVFVISSLLIHKHPFYVSVADCKYNPQQKSIQISIRLFTNDIESALKKINKNSIDLINPKKKSDADTLLFRYIKTHFKILVNKHPGQLDYIGYEKEEESVWVYMEVANIIKPKSIVVENTILFDFLPLQTNIVHMEVNGTKKSKKVNNPDKNIEFIF